MFIFFLLWGKCVHTVIIVTVIHVYNVCLSCYITFYVLTYILDKTDPQPECFHFTYYFIEKLKCKVKASLLIDRSQFYHFNVMLVFPVTKIVLTV